MNGKLNYKWKKNLLKIPNSARSATYSALTKVLGVGVFLLFMVPAACSIWPQNISISADRLRYDKN